ncbi:MAG TPA: M3 family metallopeptidase [Candidatus Saccharimonadales bacterium]|nr:M3 family metallopeptidase [Candidatus Saccharimonadales bacterium]
MNLDNIRNMLENAHIIQNEETYSQFAGLKYDPTIIEHVSSIKIQCCQLFMKSHHSPRELFLSSLEIIAEDKTKRLEQKLHEIRNTKVVDKRYKLEGNYINWSNWRQFNALEENHKHRKDVFDCFIDKSELLKPVIEKRFTNIREIYQTEGKMNPLQGYLEDENISYQSLTQFIEDLADRTKKIFGERFITISNKIFGRDPEYFDDFYYFRNRIFKDISDKFTKVNPISIVLNTMKDLGIDVNKISYDIEDRKNKYPSPICFFIKIPSDIRVLYRQESPYFDFQGCFHESGHAMHATSIKADLEYEKKYHIPMGVTEIFSIFLERLTRNRAYLQKKINLTNMKSLDKIIELNKFMELFFIVFYSANSLTKMKFWADNLSTEETNKKYSEMINKYTGIEMPGQYWMLHHIMPESIMYVPSYLLAAVRAAELERKIEEKFGQNWWELKEVGTYLKSLMEEGANINLSEFSKLDSQLFLKEITN